MIRIHELDSMVKDDLSKVTLEPFESKGKIELFGDFTHRLARELYEFYCRLHPDKSHPIQYQRRKSHRDNAFQHTEYLAKTGALAASIHKNNGIIYELGCGIAIPSITSYKLNGLPVIAIDKKKREVKRAKILSKELNADLELIADKAENVIAKRGLKPEDVVIITRPAGSLTNYWKELLRNYEFTLVLNGYYYPEDYSYEDLLEMIDTIVDKYFKKYDYNVKVGKSKFDEHLLVFLASKNPFNNSY